MKSALTVVEKATKLKHLETMEDRQVTPDFKEDRVFSLYDINYIAINLLEDIGLILDDHIHEFESDITDFDKGLLAREVLLNLKNRL